jgi:hypothetical protein
MKLDKTKEFENDKVADQVRAYVEANGPIYIEGMYRFEDSELEHIITIGTEIMLNHWGMARYSPGGFVQSFLDNNLKETFAKADHINRKAIFFYVIMICNIKFPH